MSSPERFYPTEENLGRNCMYWDAEHGCKYPKEEMTRRRSCEGVVDDVCLFLKDGRKAKSLSPQQMMDLKTRPPSTDKSYIPPGNTEK